MISVWDDRPLNQSSTASCTNCGNAVKLWIEIRSHDGVSWCHLCFECLDDANAARAEHARGSDHPPGWREIGCMKCGGPITAKTMGELHSLKTGMCQEHS